MSGVDRWEVRHELYEDVEVEAEDRLRAIIAAAKVWGVRWLPHCAGVPDEETRPGKRGGGIWQGRSDLRYPAASAASL